jgi:hypothetical protein
VYGMALGLGLASLAVDAWMPMAASLPVRLAIVLAYPAAVIAFRVVPRSDLRAARRKLRRAPQPSGSS